MNSVQGFAKLVYFEEKGGSYLFLLSFAKPVKAGSTEQNMNPRQFWARMPKNKANAFDPSSVSAHDDVEIFGWVNSLVFREENGTEEIFPEVMLSSVNKAVETGKHPKSVRKYYNQITVSTYIKYVHNLSPEDELDPDKPVFVVGQIGAWRERPGEGDTKGIRRSDTLQFPLFRSAKQAILKSHAMDEAEGSGFILQGNISGIVTYENKMVEIGTDDSGEKIRKRKRKERYHPAVAFLTAKQTRLLPERMMNPVNQLNGHEEGEELE